MGLREAIDAIVDSEIGKLGERESRRLEQARGRLRLYGQLAVEYAENANAQGEARQIYEAVANNIDALHEIVYRHGGAIEAAREDLGVLRNSPLMVLGLIDATEDGPGYRIGVTERGYNLFRQTTDCRPAA